VTNKITEALVDGAKKLGKTLGEDAGKTIKALYHDTHVRLKKVSGSYREIDAHHAAEIEKLRTGETPIYHMADDGSIKRLHPDGRHEDLTDDDKSRLGLDDANVGRPRAGEENARLKRPSEDGYTDPRPRIKSEQVDFGSTDLGVATQLARHKNNSYGRANSQGKWKSNNYAAAKVTGANGKGDFILVARSNGYRHSERMIGTPFLRQGETDRIRELYTEREPCSDKANCNAWVAERMDHIKVTHSAEYGPEDDSKQRGNDMMRRYLGELQLVR
jgi:Xanthomonas XOO_2897-like deaminase